MKQWISMGDSFIKIYKWSITIEWFDGIYFKFEKKTSVVLELLLVQIIYIYRLKLLTEAKYKQKFHCLSTTTILR